MSPRQKFSKIHEIELDDINSWKDKIFLTFDIDWCSDEVLSYTLDIIEKYNIKATFFVTHETTLLKRMRENKNIELGIHPNFNFLLNGDFRQGKNVEEVIRFYKQIVPDAISIRSHSLTQGSTILASFEKFGLIYECNTFIPLIGGVQNPYQYTKQLIKVAHVFEDDVRHLYEKEWNVDTYINYEGIKVFDFHPIHIFLNTESMDRYENVRPHFQDYEKLQNNRNTSTYGTKDFLVNLIEKCGVSIYED